MFYILVFQPSAEWPLLKTPLSPVASLAWFVKPRCASFRRTGATYRNGCGSKDQGQQIVEGVICHDQQSDAVSVMADTELADGQAQCCCSTYDQSSKKWKLSCNGSRHL